MWWKSIHLEESYYIQTDTCSFAMELLPANSCQGKEVAEEELDLWTTYIFS